MPTLKSYRPAPPMPVGAPKDQDAISWQWLKAIVLRHKRELVIANIVAVAGAVASVPIPLLMPLMVDEVLLRQPGRIVAFVDAAIPAAWPDAWHGPALYILFALGVTLLLRFGALAAGVWQTRQFTRIAKEVTYRLRERMLRHLQTIAMSEYETMGGGTVTSHFITDVGSIDDFIGETVSKFVIATLMVAGAAVVLFIMHWPLALFIVFMNPFVIWVTVQFGKRVKELKRHENSAFELFQQSLGETLDAIGQIRAANRERHYIGRVIDRAAAVRRHSAAFSWKSDAATRLSFVVFLFGFDCFRAISMLLVVYSDLTIGQMMAVFGYLWFMMAPVQELLNIHYAWFGAKAAYGRVNELLSTRREPRYPTLENPFAGRPTVGLEIRDAVFAYGDGEEILRGVSLVLCPGEKIAVVGASGGGKSTLAQAVLGLYPLRSGRIQFGGADIKRIGLGLVRENVGVVLQHPALLNDTARNNLTMGLPRSDGELWRALAMAQLDDAVAKMPHGLDTVVGRGGVRLSGGERQRLAIARMILSAPKVVILDEATSALDAATENKLHDAMSDFLRQRTTIIIAHRLSAVRRADRVFVFEDGRVVEQGSHEELIGARGLYESLYGHAAV